MQKKWLAALLSVVLVCSSFVGCKGPAVGATGGNTKDYPVTVANVVFKEPPKGVAVLSENLADVILAIGYEAQLKAKSADCVQSDLSVLPNVSLDDVEAIKNSGADTVFVDTAPTQQQVQALTNAELKVVAIAPATGRKDFTRLYTQVASAMKGAKTGYERGEQISASIFSTIDDVARQIPKTDTPVTVSYLFDTNGGAATGDTMQGELIEDAGLVNAVSDGAGNKADIGTLLMVQPQYIFCPVGLKDTLASTERYKDLTAVQEGKVFEMDEKWMKLQGRNMVKAVAFMAGTVFPELAEGSTTLSSAPAQEASSQVPSTGSAAASSKAPVSSSPSSAAASSAPATGGALKNGSQGDEVMKLQKRLMELGYLFVKPSGLYAEGTEQSVKDFQYLNGLEATGVADAKTLTLLYSDSAKKRTN